MSSRPGWNSHDTAAWLQWWDTTPKDEICASRTLPEVGIVISEDAALALALSEALRGTGNVSPNPLVGAVIVGPGGEFIAAGAHLKVGGPHAEVEAVRDAQNHDLNDATMYVTLEPCAHHGRTPPCANMLAALPLRKIVYICDDPHEKVNGRGLKILIAAGKEVEQATSWKSRGEDLAEIFFCNQRDSRLFVGMKVASTRSGVYAGTDSSRTWITGERSRDYGHFLRLRYDAILVGPGTVLLDDPTLNVRHSKLKGRTPMRVVLDPDGTLAISGFVFNLLTVEPDNTLWMTGTAVGPLDDLMRFGVKTLCLNLDAQGNFSWPDIFSSLRSLGVRSLLIEGGAGIWKNALAAGAVDKVHWFIAGADGPRDGISWHPSDDVLRASEGAIPVPLGKDSYVEFNL